MNRFVTYLLQAKHRTTGQKLALKTIQGYMNGVRSFLCFYDIDISTSKFQRKVKMPKLYKDEEAVDAADIRTIMLSCNNRRLKPYLLVLASSGLRAAEACAIRICDIDFDSTDKPTKIHVRREYAKTRVARDVYISNEATKYLQEWLKWKYREKRIYGHGNSKKVVQGRIAKDSDLVFTHHQTLVDASAIYFKVRSEFVSLLRTVGFERRKEGIQRRTITLHSFRRYVKTVISDQVSKDYSEWFLGHAKSPYYTMKEPMRREIYQTKCMKYLTFLDYSALEARGKNIEAQLEESREETSRLREEVRSYAPLIDQIKELRSRMDELVKVAKST